MARYLRRATWPRGPRDLLGAHLRTRNERISSPLIILKPKKTSRLRAAFKRSALQFCDVPYAQPAENPPSRARSWNGSYLAILFGSLIFEVFAISISPSYQVIGRRSRTGERQKRPISAAQCVSSANQFTTPSHDRDEKEGANRRRRQNDH